jgi:hypothetical protein
VAESLEQMLSCQALEEDCSEIQEAMSDLEDKANTDLSHLLAFRDIWRHCETITDKLDSWLSFMEKNKDLNQVPINMRKFWVCVIFKRFNILL